MPERDRTPIASPSCPLGFCTATFQSLPSALLPYKRMLPPTAITAPLTSFAFLNNPALHHRQPFSYRSKIKSAFIPYIYRRNTFICIGILACIFRYFFIFMLYYLLYLYLRSFSYLLYSEILLSPDVS